MFLKFYFSTFIKCILGNIGKGSGAVKFDSKHGLFSRL